MRLLSPVFCIMLAGCVVEPSGSRLCDAPSPVSELSERLDRLHGEADYEAMVQTLETVPTAERDVCWYASIGHALQDLWDLPRAERELMTGMERFPESSEIPRSLANVYAYMGRFSEAEALLLDALDAGPPPDKVLWLRDALARTYREMGDYESAKGAWDENLRDAPDDVSFLLNSISVEGLLGHLDEARQRADRAGAQGLSAFGRNVGRQYLGFAAHFGGEQTEAEEHLESLLSAFDPQFSGSVALLSIVLDHRVQDAHDSIETLHPSSLPPPLRAADAGLQAMLGDARALEEVMQGWESTEPRIRLTLTRSLLAIGDPRAVDVARSLLDSVPDNPHYEYLLGRALRAAGEADWEDHARAAASACPDNVVFQRATTSDP